MDLHIWNLLIVNFSLLYSFRSEHTNQNADIATHIFHFYFLAIFLLESIQTERE